MVIQSSNALMGAKSSKKTSYKATEETMMRNRSTGEMRYSGRSFQMSYEETLTSMQYHEGGVLEGQEAFGSKSDNYGDLARNTPFANIASNVTRNNAFNQKNAVRDFVRQLREYMIEMHNRMLERFGIARRNRSEIFVSVEGGYALNLSSGMASVNVWDRVQRNSYTYEESEEMSFETTGKVVTADGREIEFNLQVSMSRQYIEEMEECCKDNVLSIMTDPLVICLDSNPVSVSDQKWLFDIDADGKMDSISMLSKGAGFLVYDKNGDGVINDGTEMFGSRTGNGFRELSQYDEDGNGWIDENDSIYEKLSVWVKDDAGQDNRISLKDAKVGAIYLASMSTEFALKSLTDNQHNAQIRRTGIYLAEDGTSNTIQQLDMVKALIS